MTAIDHRAEAEALISACDAMRDGYAHEIPWHEIQAAATLAQVHATLAAGNPVADQHASEALASARRAFDALSRKHVALHEAVRTLVQSATPAAAPGYWMAPEDLMKRLAELVGEVSP